MNSSECLLLVLALCFACEDCICVRKDKPTWRPEGCLWGEKQAILKLRKEGKSIRAIAQALGIACTTTWNVLKKKETPGILSNRPRTDRPRKTTAVDDRNIESCEENPKISVWILGEDSNIEAIHTDANSSVVRIGRLDYNLQRSTEMTHASSGTKIMEWCDQD